MARRALMGAACAVLVSSCSGPAAPTLDGVHAELTPAGLVATNHRSDPVFYFAIERNISARVDWAPCIGDGPCPHIDPGRSKTIPYGQLMWGVDGSREALFYWWLMVPDGSGGLRPDSIRVMVAGR